MIKIVFTLLLTTTISFAVDTRPAHRKSRFTPETREDHTAAPRDPKVPAKPDLFCTSKGVNDAGYVVSGFIQDGGKLLTQISPVTFAGSNEVLFKGVLKVFKAKAINGNNTFELRDHKDEANTVIRLVENGEDKLMKINGKSFTGNNNDFSILSCSVSEELGKLLK